MTCNNNTPTMSLSVGTVDSGATPKVEITNHGTPQNTDWVMDMTLPETDPATLSSAKAYTDQKINGLPLSAKSQLYAHYVYIANTAAVEDRLYLRGQIFFINSTNTEVKNYADLAGMITGRAAVSGLWRESTDTGSDGRQLTKLACRINRYAPNDDIRIGGVCIELGNLGWRELFLNSADIGFADTVIPVGSNAG